MRGTLITFEGTDGSGKTTQLRRCAGRLEALGVPHMVTREPGGTSAGAAIRALVLERRAPGLAAETELLLYAADRAQHVRERLEPALASGLVVLCDRYTDATVAYQGRGRGLDAGLISELNRIATGGLSPDLTLLLDLPVDESLRRLAGRSGEAPTRFDLEAREFHERVRRGYLEIAAAEPERVRLLDASLPVDDLAALVAETVERALGRSTVRGS